MTVVTPDDCPRARVMLGYVDVSDQCTAADAEEGWVDLLDLREGKVVAGEDGKAVTRRVYGRVEVRCPDAC